MKCPHCNKVLKVEDYVEINLESYHNSAVATTLCCGASLSKSKLTFTPIVV
jgi:hypothetical protein